MTTIKLNLPKLRNILFSTREVFSNDETNSRVVRFLSKAYFEHSDKSFEAVSRPVAFTEEFFMAMPTRRAFDAEIELCEAILAFNQNKIDGESCKVALEKFLYSHTFVYSWQNFGTLNATIERTIKDDSEFVFEETCELFLFSFGEKSFVCNAIQMWLIYLLERSKDVNLNFKAVRLNES